MKIREQTGLRPHACVVSEDAEFLADIPAELAGLYSVVPQSTVRELLGIDDDRYRAVLSAPAGSANSGLLCQQALDYLRRTHPDRFVYADCTNVDRVVVKEEDVVVYAGGHRVTAGHVVLCTNGFVDHVVEDGAGSPVRLAADQQITGRVAYMTAFLDESRRHPIAMSYIRNAVIGGPTPYAYVTRRTYDLDGGTVTLTCMGGPEYNFHDPVYERDAIFPGDLVQMMDDDVRPFAQAARAPGRAYDFHWHGLMGYNESRLRVVGAHRRYEPYLFASAFTRLDGLSVTTKSQISMEDLVGRAFFMSSCAPERLGDRVPEFEAGLRAALAPFATDGTVTEIAEMVALLARRPE
jgi:glycine/D-amino acid oxidase-like deaminating enzyme